jgi:hypothetical protein
MYSSLLLFIPYFLLPNNTLHGYKMGFLLLAPVSLMNHLRNCDPENIYKLPYKSNELIRILDHMCITYLNSISLFRSYTASAIAVFVEYKSNKINTALHIINIVYQYYISLYKLQMTVAIVLCCYGFRYNKEKTWLRHKRYIWHSGIVLYTYYAGLCVNKLNTCTIT